MPRKILGVIPARFDSSRFPGKVLSQIASKSMLEHVYERASQARYLTGVLIATDDARVSEVARNFGARVRMTRSDHISGTDRVAEVASAETCDLVVNIQGDEPLIDPAAIDAAILPMVHDPEVPMATLKKRIEDASEITNPNVVKVITDRSGDAIYFSRCPIPFYREAARPEGDPGPRPPAPGSNTWDSTCTAVIFFWPIPSCPWGRSNRRSVWNSSAHSKMATTYGWWKQSTNRLA